MSELQETTDKSDDSSNQSNSEYSGDNDSEYSGDNDSEYSGDNDSEYSGDNDSEYSGDSDSSIEIMVDDKFYVEIEIELDRPMLNSALQWAHPESKVSCIKLVHIYRYTTDGEICLLSETEKMSIAYPYDNISFTVKDCDDPDQTLIEKKYDAKNGLYFTTEEFVEKIVEFEKTARNYRKIGQSIDTTHKVFDGIIPTQTLGLYETNWI